jgi:hypothetical protein
LPEKSDFAALGGRNVVLVFVESYGVVTARDPGFAATMDPLRARLQAALEQAGFASATGLLRSPITGGGSWMGHGTLLAGAKIAAQYSSVVFRTAPVPLTAPVALQQVHVTRRERLDAEPVLNHGRRSRKGASFGQHQEHQGRAE